MDGLDLLGAVDALADQYITLRVKHIDSVKLRNKLGGSKGTLAEGALHFVDAAPKAALDLVLPFAVNKAKDYGVELEAAITDKPAKGKRAVSEFWFGLGVGGVVGGSALLIVKTLGALFGRR